MSPTTLKEGMFKKGGQNPAPSTKRLAPPRGQGTPQSRRGLAAAQARIAALTEIVAAQSDLLVAYRLNSHEKADKALRRLEKAKQALEVLQP